MADAPVPITFSALYQRLNRHLQKEDSLLKKAHGKYEKAQFGEWFVLNLRHNTVPRRHVNPIALAQELGLVKPWETVGEGEQG